VYREYLFSIKERLNIDIFCSIRNSFVVFFFNYKIHFLRIYDIYFDQKKYFGHKFVKEFNSLGELEQRKGEWSNRIAALWSST
jgi:hypothetical protein